MSARADGVGLPLPRLRSSYGSYMVYDQQKDIHRLDTQLSRKLRPASGFTKISSPSLWVVREEMATAQPSVVDHLEPDNVAIADADDNDTASESASTRSASIASSITAYKYENGRRYHAYREGAYYLPNDETEQARLDLLHHIYGLGIDGELYLAPLKDIKNCLDFGTGTGIWAIDFADAFPNAEVIGTDLSPIQPSWIPPNLKFYVDDVEADWNYPEKLDFVHGRSMGGHIKDWKRLFKQAFDSLEPGTGWFEMHEFEGYAHSRVDPNLNKCENLKQWTNLVNDASKQFGNDLSMGPRVKQLMTDAGFVDVKEKIVEVPLSPWAKGQKAKHMGVVQQEQFCDAIDSYTIALFTRVLGWTQEECELIMTKAKNEVRDRTNQLYINFFYVYGRRPKS